MKRVNFADFVLVISLALLLPAAADSIPEIVKKTKPAIVELVAMDENGSPTKLGTGFFVSPDGLVVTNFHVVSEASSLAAISNNGATFSFEKVTARPQGVDLAILKFRATNVPFLTLGQSTNKVEGDQVIVIGNPSGLTGTVSDGIISAFRKDPDYIQITAPISPGSSGSPVMDESGKVIGVATWQKTGGQNLNFAIPVETVIQAIASIGSNEHPLLLAPVLRHEVRQFKAEAETKLLADVAFSPDDRAIVSDSFDKSNYSDDSVRLWDVETGREIRRLDTEDIHYVGALKFAPDGRYVLSLYSKPRKICIWDVATGRVVRRLLPDLREGALSGATFSRDGRYVVAAGDQDTIVVWDVKTGREISHFRDAEAGDKHVSFSPDARSLIFVGSDGVDNRDQLSLRDVATGSEIRKFAGKNSYGLIHVYFSPDGRHVISSNMENSIYLWDVETGAELRRFAVKALGPIEVAFLPDDRLILYAGWRGATLHLFDVKTGEDLCHFRPRTLVAASLDIPEAVDCIAVSRDGRFAASGHDDGTIRLWDLRLD
jgi:S1-C subfamily serine protease